MREGHRARLLPRARRALPRELLPPPLPVRRRDARARAHARSSRSTTTAATRCAASSTASCARATARSRSTTTRPVAGVPKQDELDRDRQLALYELGVRARSSARRARCGSSGTTCCRRRCAVSTRTPEQLDALREADAPRRSTGSAPSRSSPPRPSGALQLVRVPRRSAPRSPRAPAPSAALPPDRSSPPRRSCGQLLRCSGCASVARHGPSHRTHPDAARQLHLPPRLRGDAARPRSWTRPRPSPSSRRVEALGARVTKILSTHHHPDHSTANPELAKRYGAPVFGHASDRDRLPGFTHGLEEGDAITVGRETARDRSSSRPIRAATSPTSSTRGAVFCGDTLFAAGCGRLFEGTPEMMFAR